MDKPGTSSKRTIRGEKGAFSEGGRGEEVLSVRLLFDPDPSTVTIFRWSRLVFRQAIRNQGLALSLTLVLFSNSMSNSVVISAIAFQIQAGI
jgi:hypothetical protein